MRRASMRAGALLLAAGWFLCPPLCAAGEETAGRRLVIDAARSEVRFTTRATKHDVTGRSRSLAGSVEIPEGSLSGAKNGVARLPVSSLDAGRGRLNRNMHESLEADRHPEILFQAKRFEKSAEDGAADGMWRGAMHGFLTVRGVMRPVTFQVTGRWEEEALHAEGWTEFKLTYFGIEPPRFLRLFKVKDHVRVEFEVVAVPGPDAP
jgi:polyisoprenoid-binding protein YceI